MSEVISSKKTGMIWTIKGYKCAICRILMQAKEEGDYECPLCGQNIKMSVI